MISATPLRPSIPESAEKSVPRHSPPLKLARNRNRLQFRFRQDKPRDHKAGNSPASRILRNQHHALALKQRSISRARPLRSLIQPRRNLCQPVHVRILKRANPKARLLRHARCAVIAKNLRVRPPQIVPVQQRQISKIPVQHPRQAQLNRIPRRRRLDPHQLDIPKRRRSPSQPPHHRKPQLRWCPRSLAFGTGDMWRSSSAPASNSRATSIRPQPQKHLVPMRIQRRRLHPRLRRQYRQP